MSGAKRAAIYIRVSTVEQETNLQEHELQEYCERRDWSRVVYRDKGEGGAKNDRPALTNMMNDLQRRQNRFSRGLGSGSVGEIVETVVIELRINNAMT